MVQEQDEQSRSRRGTSEGMPVDTLPQKVQLECSKFVARLRRQQVPHALDIARKTLEIMRLVVATSGAKDLGGLIALIKQAGQILVSAQPHELVIGNMVRRVLYIVREETREQAMAPEGGAAQSSSATNGGRSLHRILEAPPDAPDYSELPAKNLKAPILEVLNEVIEELSSVSAAIAEQAIEHIHSNEVILTHGRDPAVEAFLKAAHKKRTFEVIVCETSPAMEGQQTAAALAEARSQLRTCPNPEPTNHPALLLAVPLAQTPSPGPSPNPDPNPTPTPAPHLTRRVSRRRSSRTRRSSR